MARAVSTQFGLHVIARHIPPVMSADGLSVVTPPRLESQVQGGAWVGIVTLPATTPDEARQDVSYDLDEEPSTRLVVTYTLGVVATIYQCASLDRGYSWA